MEGKYVDFDGDGFGYMTHNMAVPAYEGTSAIAALPAFPLVYHSDHATIRRHLTARGKLWENHQGYQYKQYEGIAKTHFFQSRDESQHQKPHCHRHESIYYFQPGR